MAEESEARHMSSGQAMGSHLARRHTTVRPVKRWTQRRWTRGQFVRCTHCGMMRKSKRSGEEDAAGRWYCCNECRVQAFKLQEISEENQRLRKILDCDPVTGIPSRALMGELWERVASTGTPAVLFVDIDHFKAINDRWGHAIGDQVLGIVAQRMAGVLRPHDACVRYGGEEFVCFLAALDMPQAMDIAERIREAVSRDPITGDAWTVLVSVSIGVMLGEPQGASLTQLLECADRALFQAKTRGRNQVVIHARSPQGGLEKRLS